MAYSSIFAKLKKEILFGNMTNERVFEIDKEVNRLWEKVSEKEREDFVESGAGELLEMMLEYPE